MHVSYRVRQQVHVDVHRGQWRLQLHRCVEWTLHVCSHRVCDGVHRNHVSPN